MSLRSCWLRRRQPDSVNGLIVVYGRLQTDYRDAATSSIYSGIALYLRPRPGGYVPDVYGNLLTQRVGQLLPPGFFGQTLPGSWRS